MRTRSRSLFTDFIPHNNTTSNNSGSNTNSPTSTREGRQFSPTSPILQSFRTTQSLVEEDVGTEPKTLSISLRDNSPTVGSNSSSPSSNPSSFSSALNGGTTTFFTPHSPTTPSPSTSTPRRRKLSLGLSSMQNMNSTPLSSSPTPSPLTMNPSTTVQQATSGGTYVPGTFNQSPSPPSSTSPSSLSSSPSNSLFINDAAGSSSPRNYSPRRYSIMPAVGFATPPPLSSSSNGSSTPTGGNSRRNSLERKVSEAFAFPNINEKPMNNRLREIKSMELDEQMDYNSYNNSSSNNNNNNNDSSSNNIIDDMGGLLNYISPQFLQPAVPAQPVLERRRSFKRNPSSPSVVGDHEVPSLIPTFQRKDSVSSLEQVRELQRVPSKSSNLTVVASPSSNSTSSNSIAPIRGKISCNSL
ncbi:predicted protein [Naegleria gruberi]|uniref:Predicted protein n=1 Tax=Naegleria gruberi TaxID=5762 RepID=D2V535_NAEGR|nr:uncharacterized protein NAEGRDRAFT_64000 [Naegleria gruberi]EFC48039.1 predicted protein [Naegleria gruberi]|eukprot:XP_002680783.1 predicted protein [Naegleria gruberi strain NEG-M]